MSNFGTMMLTPVRTLFLIFLCLWTSPTGSEALQWINSTTMGQIQACSGDNLTFLWTFKLDPGEQLEDIKWLYSRQQSPSATPDLLANYIYGHFIASPPVANRIVYLGNGNLALSHVTPADAGRYTVEVVTTHSGGSGYSSERQDAKVEVLEPPSTTATSLTAGVASKAVYDKVTGEWHVLLTCGRVMTTGNAAPNVRWRTPSGSDLASSYSDNGTFFLVVPNPVEAGTYTCHLPHNPSAALCLPNATSLVYEASLHMDSVSPRFILLEAKQEALLQQNQQLAGQLRNTTDTLTHTDSMLTQVRQDLNATMNELSNTNQELTMTKNTLTDVQKQLAGMQTALNDVKNCCNATATSARNSSVSMSTLMAINQQAREAKNAVSSIQVGLKNVKQEVKEMKNCCKKKPTSHQTAQNRPHTEETKSPQEPMTSSAPDDSYTTQASILASTGRQTDSNGEWVLILQDLTEHIAAVESTLQQYQDLCRKRIAFHAQAAHQRYNNSAHILFNEEIFLNEGNAFNKTTGEFVTPVSGLYVFLATSSAYGVYGASCDVDLMVDSRVVVRLLGSDNSVYNQVTGHAVIHLNQGEKVWVRSIGVTDIDVRSIFSGFLLTPDW